MNVAVILAAGAGSRMGLQVPKQFMMLKGRTVLEYSAETFQNHPAMDQMVIVTSAPYINKVWELAEDNGWSKVSKVLEGGAERYHSSLSAINAYADYPDCNLIFHDAARPLIDSETIDRVVWAMQRCNACTVAIPCADTIVKVSKESSGYGKIEQIPDRNLLCQEQTPQAFKQSVIAQAYSIALQDPDFRSTDDCGTVVKYLPQEPVYTVPGNRLNMKITYPDDIPLMESLLGLLS